MVLLNSWLATWIHPLFVCMGGCFGCDTKRTPIISVDDPSKGPRIQGKLVRKPSVSDDWWSTSTFDLDYCAAQSQRSISSITSSNTAVDNSTNGKADFVNHGLNVWNESRLRWVESDRSDHSQNQKPIISWNPTHESLLLNKRPFPEPIPLSEAIDLLVDVWDHEGLYD